MWLSAGLEQVMISDTATTARKPGTGALGCGGHFNGMFSPSASCLHADNSCRQESSEDDYEEDEANAKKLGMVIDKRQAKDEKKPTGIQVLALCPRHSHSA